MDPGDSGATKGLSKGIYDAINANLYPTLPAPQPGQDDVRPKIQDGWRHLAFAVATGIVNTLAKDSTALAPVPYAQTTSSSTDDATYWAWLKDFAGVFTTWASGGAPTIVTLQTAIQTFATGHPSVPASLTGSLK